MSAPTRRRPRARGSIKPMTSGALRVSVYAGLDALTGRRYYLREVIPAGTANIDAAAEAVRTRFVNQVDERRSPRTSATLDQLLDRYLDTADLADRTRATYAGYLAKHVRPFLGTRKVSALDAETLETLYARMRRCRDHCEGRRSTEHHTSQKHTCDERCRPHHCKPLANWTIRKIHYILSAAYQSAIRWRWTSTNPTSAALKPAPPPINPSPPSAEAASQLLQSAWTGDPAWGMYLWLAMVTGARRGELCALRWLDVDLDRGVLVLTGTKSGGDVRRLALDPQSVEILARALVTAKEQAAEMGLKYASEHFVFSKTDPRIPVTPASVSMRYKRLARKLGIKSHLHNLRHYSATELIAAGVDVRTVAGRLGHKDATTTLKVYAAWLGEADQRAAQTLFQRMPELPSQPPAANDSPYQVVAGDLRAAIIDGEYTSEMTFPSTQAIAAKFSVSIGTVNRATQLLCAWGLLKAGRGYRLAVRPREEWPDEFKVVIEIADRPSESSSESPSEAPRSSSLPLREFRLILDDRTVREFSASADVSHPDVLRKILVNAVGRAKGQEPIDQYDLEVRDAETGDLLTVFVAVGD